VTSSPCECPRARRSATASRTLRQVLRGVPDAGPLVVQARPRPHAAGGGRSACPGFCLMPPMTARSMTTPVKVTVPGSIRPSSPSARFTWTMRSPRKTQVFLSMVHSSCRPLVSSGRPLPPCVGRPRPRRPRRRLRGSSPPPWTAPRTARPAGSSRRTDADGGEGLLFGAAAPALDLLVDRGAAARRGRWAARSGRRTTGRRGVAPGCCPARRAGSTSPLRPLGAVSHRGVDESAPGAVRGLPYPRQRGPVRSAACCGNRSELSNGPETGAVDNRYGGSRGVGAVMG